MMLTGRYTHVYVTYMYIYTRIYKHTFAATQRLTRMLGNPHNNNGYDDKATAAHVFNSTLMLPRKRVQARTCVRVCRGRACVCSLTARMFAHATHAMRCTYYTYSCNGRRTVAAQWPHSGRTVAAQWPLVFHNSFLEAPRNLSSTLYMYIIRLSLERCTRAQTIVKYKRLLCGYCAATVRPLCGHCAATVRPPWGSGTTLQRES